MNIRTIGNLFFSTFIVCMSFVSNAQEQAQEPEQDKLETIMSSWAEGSLQTIAGTSVDEATGSWVDAPKYEIGPWDVELINPLTGRFFWSHDGKNNDFLVELGEGVYINRYKTEDGEETVVEHQLLETTVYSPDNWTILIAWKKRSESDAQAYAEMSIAGDVFVRTDYIDDIETGQRKRTSYTLHRRILN